MEVKEEKTGTLAQRFTNAVVAAYGDVARGIEVTPKQMNLISNYYIKIDQMIKNPDSKIKSWKQVRLHELAITLAHMAKLNLDMSQDHLSFMPFNHKNSDTFDLVPCISKNGYWYIAKKFALDPPDNFTVELVYGNDKFSVIKKDANHECDSYIFEITSPFNRGKIVGGFGCLEYPEKTKNKLIAMSESDILKYKPPYAKPTFWSGENAKKMYEKTIAKQLLRGIPRDPDKVNGVEDSFKRIEAQELAYTASIAQSEIDENMCSGDVIDIDVEYKPCTEPNPKVTMMQYTDVENPVEVVEDTNLFGDEVLPEDDVLA